MARRLVAPAVVALGCAALGLSAASSATARTSVRHGLSVVVPAGWRVSYQPLTPCSDPVERFTLFHGDQALTVEERTDPVPEELRGRPARFGVSGKPSPLECCAIEGMPGWSIQFSDHGRAFYAYLYPGRESPRALLSVLDTFRA
jgi:hypothetical protein